MISFSLTAQQFHKVKEWEQEQNRIMIEKQKKNPPDAPRALLEACWETGNPYYGATGGEITYSFTPTSIGVITEVKYAMTGKTLDITDYESW